MSAARALFSENGFHNTGIAQIAKRSGVLVGQLYRDFANKEAIVAEIVEHDLAPLLSDGSLERAIASGDTIAVRGWLFRFVAGTEDQDLRLIMEIIAEISRNERLAAIAESVHARLDRCVSAAVEMLVSDRVGHYARERLADTIRVIAGGMMQRRAAHRESVNPELVEMLMLIIDREIEALQSSDGAGPRDRSL